MQEGPGLLMQRNETVAWVMVVWCSACMWIGWMGGWVITRRIFLHYFYSLIYFISCRIFHLSIYYYILFPPFFCLVVYSSTPPTLALPFVSCRLLQPRASLGLSVCFSALGPGVVIQRTVLLIVHAVSPFAGFAETLEAWAMFYPAGL